MPATAHELPTWECFELLAGRRIGHLCLVDGGYPIAVPVNYRVVNDDGAHPGWSCGPHRRRWSGAARGRAPSRSTRSTSTTAGRGA